MFPDKTKGKNYRKRLQVKLKRDLLLLSSDTWICDECGGCSCGSRCICFDSLDKHNHAETVPVCMCDNPKFGMNCVCEWVRNNPGTRSFVCEYDGIYNASRPRCNKCEEILSPSVEARYQ